MSVRPHGAIGGSQQRPPCSHSRQHLNRRSFLKTAVATLGATAGLVAAQAFPVTGKAAEEKKNPPSKSLRIARCPVTGKQISPEISIDYREATLYFSSAECIDKFRRDRATYEAKANAQLVATEQFGQFCCPLTGEAVVPQLKMEVCGVDVCFSTPECLKRMEQASADQRAEMVFGKGFDKAFAVYEDESSTSESAEATKKWQCVACGYVHTGSSPPEGCPRCGANSAAFVPMS